MDDDDELVALFVRIPRSTHRRMKQRAEQEDRTLSAQVRVALDRHLRETAPLPKRTDGTKVHATADRVRVVEPRFKGKP